MAGRISALLNDQPDKLEKVSQHPIYGIVEYYGRINIRGEWYIYSQQQDRLLRSPNPPSQQGLFDAPTQ